MAARERERAKGLEAEAAAAIRLAEMLEREAAERERERTALSPREQLRNVNSDMLPTDHRTAISAGQRRRDEAFGRAINKAGYSLRSLAAALEVSPAMLHAHRQPKAEANSRPIPAARAERVRELTGWPDDAAHWPCGIAS